MSDRNGTREGGTSQVSENVTESKSSGHLPNQAALIRAGEERPPQTKVWGLGKDGKPRELKRGKSKKFTVRCLNLSGLPDLLPTIIQATLDGALWWQPLVQKAAEAGISGLTKTTSLTTALVLYGHDPSLDPTRALADPGLTRLKYLQNNGLLETAQTLLHALNYRKTNCLAVYGLTGRKADAA